MFKKGGNRKLKKNKFYTKPSLGNEAKKLLAKAVKKYPPLWDVNNEHYMKRGVVCSCWGKVAKIVNVSVTDCKSNWKGLRDALSYRTKLKPPNVKSGDGVEQNEPEGEGVSDQGLSSNLELDSYIRKSLEEWPMWKSLRFLINNRMKRFSSTTSLDDSPPPSSPSSFDEDEEDENSFEQYGEIEIHEHEQDDSHLSPKVTEVMTVNCKRERNNHDYVTNTNDYVANNNDFMKNKRLKEPTAELVEIRNIGIAGYKSQTLKYESIYANLDRMLKKLPESVVEDLNVEFINLAYAEVKKYDN